MPDLTRQRVRDTFRHLLQVPGETAAAPVGVQTGDGDALPLAISNTTVAFTGVVDLTAATVVGGTRTHNQLVPAAVWTVVHNQNRYPAVSVTDSGGSVCVGDVQYVDENTLTVTFSAAFAGVAHLN